MAGQKLKVTNSDQTAHNVHPSPKSNKEWNQSQAAGAPPIIQSFSRAEVVVPVKCNQHPWMKANIGVLKHPLYAVSGENGAFESRRAAGNLHGRRWHERYGEKLSPSRRRKEARRRTSPSTRAPESRLHGSLEVLPAMNSR